MIIFIVGYGASNQDLLITNQGFKDDLTTGMKAIIDYRDLFHVDSDEHVHCN